MFDPANSTFNMNSQTVFLVVNNSASVNCSFVFMGGLLNRAPLGSHRSAMEIPRSAIMESPIKYYRLHCQFDLKCFLRKVLKLLPME